MVERYMWLFSRLLKKRASRLILDTSIVLRLQISFVKALAHHVKRLSKDSLFVSAKTGRNRDASVKISILKKYISPLSLDVWSVWSAQMELEVRHRCDGGDYWLHSFPHIIVLRPVLWLPQLFPRLFHMHTLHTRHTVMCPSLSNHQPQLPTRTLCACVRVCWWRPKPVPVCLTHIVHSLIINHFSFSQTRPSVIESCNNLGLI